MMDNDKEALTIPHTPGSAEGGEFDKASNEESPQTPGQAEGDEETVDAALQQADSHKE